MLREDVIKEIEEKKIMVVVRNIYDDELIRLADALAKGGVKSHMIRRTRIRLPRSNETSKNWMLCLEINCCWGLVQY